MNLSSLSNQVVTTRVNNPNNPGYSYLYSLYPCGQVPQGFCGNPSIPAPSPTFFCQYDSLVGVNNTLAYQMDNSTTLLSVMIRNDMGEMNVVYQSGHLCFNKSRIANITYTCACSVNTTTLSVMESPTCTYNAVVRSQALCSVFGITCPNTPTITPTITPTTSTPTTTRPTWGPTSWPNSTTPTPTNITTQPPTTPTPTKPPTYPPTTQPIRPGKTCNSDFDCSASFYCTSSWRCQPSKAFNVSCDRDMKSRKQCLDGACDYHTSRCVSSVPNGKKCDSDTKYICVDGNYCKPSTNTTEMGICTNTLPNGQPCSLRDGSECDSGYCSFTANSKTGTCDTNPLEQLVKAAALGLVAIILIAIGGCVFMGVSICCCVYRTCKPRAPVVVHEAPHVHAYHAPYRQLQDGYTRV